MGCQDKKFGAIIQTAQVHHTVENPPSFSGMPETELYNLYKQGSLS